jgi:hypothetical protein
LPGEGARRCLYRQAIRDFAESGRMTGKSAKDTGKALAGRRAAAKAGKPGKPRKAAKPLLLSGGNPQIARGDCDAPDHDYNAPKPGRNRHDRRRLDRAIARTVPGVRKAVKWNSPFYGVADQGWFLSYHCFAKYVKVAFFRGAALDPVPPGESRQKDVRYLDIHEHDELDEAQFTDWVKQASRLPGERM